MFPEPSESADPARSLGRTGEADVHVPGAVRGRTTADLTTAGLITQ
jgi:hypothetical protein